MEHREQAVSDGSASLRDRQKEAVRRDLRDAALHLFTENGFTATSVDDISRRAGVSRSTFFRYFGSKEAILTGPADQSGTIFIRYLMERPKNEGRMEALENALIEMNAELRSDERRDEFLAMRNAVESEPALTSTLEAASAAWRQRIALALAEREGRDEPNLEDDLAAAILRQVTDHVRITWFAESGPPVEQVIRSHFETVRRVASS